jgi:hypothetical protein
MQKLSNKQYIKFWLLFTLLSLSYWLLCKTIDVYKYTIIGVLSEILWFPMIAMLFLLPIINTYAIFKNKNSLFLYFNLALNIITILIVFLM